MKKVLLMLLMLLLLVGTAYALPSQICYPLSTGLLCLNTTTITGVDDYNTGNASEVDPLFSVVNSSLGRIGDCPGGQVVMNMTVDGIECVDSAGGGTVTSITFGDGLTGGTITSSGTGTVNFSATQRRVNETCNAGSSIRTIAEDGSVTCETDTVGYNSLGDLQSAVSNDFHNLGGTDIDTNTFWSFNASQFMNQSPNLGLNTTWLTSWFNSWSTFTNYVTGAHNVYTHLSNFTDDVVTGNYLTINDQRYNDSVSDTNEYASTLDVTGTTTKTINITLNNGTQIKGSFTDIDTDTFYVYTHLSNFTDDIGVSADWDEIGDVPTTSPENGNTTYLSTADQIYDWVISLSYITNAVSNLVNYIVAGTTNAWNIAGENITGGTIAVARMHTDMATDTELAAQDACSEITGCVENAITSYQNLSESNVEAYIFDNDNAATLNLTGYNLSVSYILLDNGGLIYDNSTHTIIE